MMNFYIGAALLCALIASPLKEVLGEHTCEALGCGNHDSVCSCEETCYSFDACCPDFEEACPHSSPTFVFKDLNLFVTTDIHSWIEGRKHEPHFNATLGDAVSLVERSKAAASALKRDVFFFDNGDINDGTGLSATAPDHVCFLSSLMQSAPYDALNLGNHELYQRNGHGAVPGEACPITGLRDSGYIAAWKGRYLTSNTVWADTREPVGSRFAVVRGEHGTTLLVFGFLYNMQDHCDAVHVEDVGATVNSTWFRDALVTHAVDVEAIVFLAHMDYNDPLVSVILGAVRQHVDEQKPVQFLTGHSHIRGWKRVDDFASSYEAGCKLNTLGFISFDKKTSKSKLWFNFADIDGNIAQFAGAANMSTDSLATPSGQALNSAISQTRAALGLETTLGCADQRYKSNAALSDPDSLWSYYMRRVLPGSLFAGHTLRLPWAVVGTGGLTYDIYQGVFTKDDAYTVSPYGNFWFIQHNFTGSELSRLLERLNAPSLNPALHLQLSDRRVLGPALAGGSWAVPDYVTSGELEKSVLYDVIYCDFDARNVEEQLKSITGKEQRPYVFKPGSNTSSVLVDWFKMQPCSADAVVV